ncbi:hypothetical protein FRB99_002778, partial [Tulasnella sp. 403]
AMFKALGLGWGNTLLAFVSFVIGGPAPYLFYHYGARLRRWSNLDKMTPQTAKS